MSTRMINSCLPGHLFYKVLLALSLMSGPGGLCAHGEFRRDTLKPELSGECPCRKYQKRAEEEYRRLILKRNDVRDPDQISAVKKNRRWPSGLKSRVKKYKPVVKRKSDRLSRVNKCN
jgi:hypothetical protein